MFFLNRIKVVHIAKCSQKCKSHSCFVSNESKSVDNTHTEHSCLREGSNCKIHPVDVKLTGCLSSFDTQKNNNGSKITNLNPASNTAWWYGTTLLYILIHFTYMILHFTLHPIPLYLVHIYTFCILVSNIEPYCTTHTLVFASTFFFYLHFQFKSSVFFWSQY